MRRYQSLIERIMQYGIDRPDRTGIGSRYMFGESIRFLDIGERFPATTVRPVPLRWVFEETMFFLRGDAQTKLLEDKGITIWKGNTSRQFLNKRGSPLMYYPVGHMGKGYGHQWRNFGGQSDIERMYRDGTDDIAEPDGFDQITDLLDRMLENPDSRRHIVSAWNPQQTHEMALPPCHIIQQFNINDGKLNSLFWMRSNDVIFGLPFNIAQYAFINLIFANILDLEPGTLVYQCGDSHIYMNQFDMANEILTRMPQSQPKVSINRKLVDLNDALTLEWEDIVVENYNPLPDVKNKPPMAV